MVRVTTPLICCIIRIAHAALSSGCAVLDRGGNREEGDSDDYRTKVCQAVRASMGGGNGSAIYGATRHTSIRCRDDAY
jgi:hypothetical protein